MGQEASDPKATPGHDNGVATPPRKHAKYDDTTMSKEKPNHGLGDEIIDIEDGETRKEQDARREFQKKQRERDEREVFLFWTDDYMAKGPTASSTSKQ